MNTIIKRVRFLMWERREGHIYAWTNFWPIRVLKVIVWFDDRFLWLNTKLGKHPEGTK